ncbi:GAF domain-containing protein [Aliikangiella sp. IMCC44359]|uniref:GAF domain-containing protein n=1 Tax=Aliikangiella sp. IMCC44359 TaxID=3459125 RepID=UPI00403AE4C8
MDTDKKSFYQLLNKQLVELLRGERNLLTNLSQFSAFMNACLEDINWVGFYLSQPDNDLLLGPFQGQVACVRIPYGKGVCGTSAENKTIEIVHDVDLFPGHIACDSRSRSEIVFPIIIEDKLIGVLDIDSPSIGRFDQSDAEGISILLATLIDSTDF